jgi:hypothetical protein
MSDERSVEEKNDARKIDKVLEEISRFQRKSRDSCIICDLGGVVERKEKRGIRAKFVAK